MLIGGRKMLSLRYRRNFDVEEDIGALVREKDRFWWLIS